MGTSYFATRLSTSLLSTLAVVALSGCAVGNLTENASGPAAAVTGIHGVTHGGQQAVVGAAITLYAPGTGGYGSAPTVLATTVTGLAGNFTLPAYNCPTPTSSLVYISAVGGDSGSGPNALLGEAAVLGPCNALTPSTFVSISEVTTIAAAYTLAPFATVSPTATNIGTSPGNALGLNNAFGAANNLANNATGNARAVNEVTGLILPTAEMNTLANILASCVNSNGLLTMLSGTTTVPSACGTLVTNTTVGGVAPANTFQAALNIAMHPGTNVSALYNLAAPAQVYAPALATAPADFSVAIGYNGGGLSLNGALGVAIDALGNAWVSTGGLSATVHSLTEISPAGVYLSGSAVGATTGFGVANLSYPIGLAIDQNGLIDVVDAGTGTIKRFNPNGSFNSTLTAASLAGPNGISIDAGGNVWVADFSTSVNYVTKITAAGAEASNSPFSVGYGNVDIAAGPLAVWDTDYSSNSFLVCRIDQTTFVVSCYYIGGPAGGIAVDHANNAWIAVTGNGSIFKAGNTGGLVNPFGGYTIPGGGVQNITIDGLGNVFAAADTATMSVLGSPGTLDELSSTAALLSPSTGGFTGSGVIPTVPDPPEGIHIDGSGNVWIAGTFNGSANTNALAEVIGIAAPVVTPRSVAVTNNTLGTRP